MTLLLTGEMSSAFLFQSTDLMNGSVPILTLKRRGITPQVRYINSLKENEATNTIKLIIIVMILLFGSSISFIGKDPTNILKNPLLSIPLVSRSTPASYPILTMVSKGKTVNEFESFFVIHQQLNKGETVIRWVIS